MAKHFTVEVKPTIAASAQHNGAYSDDDVLFDWTSFQIPKGAASLVGLTIVMRGTNAGSQAKKDIDFLFAKTVNNSAPATLGTSHATASALPAVSNHVIGFTHIDSATDYGGHTLVNFAVAATGSGAAGSHIPTLVLEGEPNSGDNVGFDTLYIAAVCAEANIDFGTTVLARGAVSSGVSLEVDNGSGGDPDAELVFAPGDVIHSATDDVLGTVSAIGAFDTNHQDIVFESTISATTADNEELYNINPIRIILSFEK